MMQQLREADLRPQWVGHGATPQRVDRIAGLPAASLLFVLFFLCAPPSKGASYEKIDRSIVNPIQSVFGGALDYVGPNLRPGVDLTGQNLSHAVLDQADLSGATLNGSLFTGASLIGADINGGKLGSVGFDLADLSGAQLLGVDARGATLEGAFLVGAAVRSADFTSGHFHGARFRDADFRETRLVDADLSGVDFEGAELEAADLSGAYLQYATLLGDSTGAALYDDETDFENAYADDVGSVLFDPVAAGWEYVPEPSATLLGVAAVLSVLLTPAFSRKAVGRR